jgi:hypothetical protein
MQRRDDAVRMEGVERSWRDRKMSRIALPVLLKSSYRNAVKTIYSMGDDAHHVELEATSQRVVSV